MPYCMPRSIRSASAVEEEPRCFCLTARSGGSYREIGWNSENQQALRWICSSGALIGRALLNPGELVGSAGSEPATTRTPNLNRLLSPFLSRGTKMLKE